MAEVNEVVKHRVSSMARGERWAYHRGHLAYDRQTSYELDQTAKLLWDAQNKGQVTLFQRREDGFHTYYAGKVR